jgi:hypothetical protein
MFNHKIFSILIGLFLILPFSQHAGALNTSIQEIQYQDIDNDLKPDLITIVADFSQIGGDKKGNLLILDKGNGTIESRDWSKKYDIKNETWIFDLNSNGSAELIIDFLEKDGIQKALIYDDTDGNKKVDYSISNKTVIILEKNPRVTVKCRDGDGWFISGKPNYNLDLNIDSDWNFFGSNADFLLKQNNVNGINDVLIRYYDVDHDGNPEIEYNDKNLEGDFNAIIVDVKDNITSKNNFLLFPLLDTVIDVDWKISKISTIHHIIPTRQMENGYFIYLNKRFQQNETPYGWENPFAFYDLADDNDEQAELIVRMLDPSKYENEFDEQSGKRYYTNIRYTWEQSNFGWYRICFYGHNEYSNIVHYPFGNLKHVDYENVPTWVVEKKWNGKIFAHNENGKWSGGEGLYESWIYPYALLNSYFNNRSIQLPDYVPNRIGDREEYDFDSVGQVKLYFSPIDRRLHLYGAKKGILILNTSQKVINEWEDISKKRVQITEKIEYYDLNGDGYLDCWVKLANGNPENFLIHFDKIIIYSDKYNLKVKEVEVEYSIFETKPPANNEEWNLLNRQLGVYDKYIGPDDFQKMYSQFEGEEITAPGMTIQNSKMFGPNLLLYINVSNEKTLNLGNLSLSPGINSILYNKTSTIFEEGNDVLKIESIKINSDSIFDFESFYNLDIDVSNMGEGIDDLSIIVYDGNTSIEDKVIGKSNNNKVGYFETSKFTINIKKPIENEILIVIKSNKIENPIVNRYNVDIGRTSVRKISLVDRLKLGTTNFELKLLFVSSMLITFTGLIILVGFILNEFREK